MADLKCCSPRFWIVNLVLTLAIASAHFWIYTSLCRMAVAAGEGGRTVPELLGWPVMALGLPVIPLGSNLLDLLPYSIRGSILGRGGTGSFYLLAGINALLCGVWTTVQVRVVPSFVRFLCRRITSRFASAKAKQMAKAVVGTK